MRKAPLLFLLLVLVSCSSNYDEPPAGEPARAPRGGGMSLRSERPSGELLDLMPPDEWWRNPRVVEPVKLTAEQFAALDKLSSEGDEVARLERDSLVALRDIRSLLTSEKPASDDIVAAANRLKSMRDSIFDRQARLLAEERTILDQKQWAALQDALQQEREERMDRMRGGYPGGMGRGGRRPGRGRFPG